MPDIHVFGLSLPTAAWVMLAVLMGLWLGYRFTRSFLYSTSIMRVHVWFSGVTALLIVLLVLLGIQASPLVIDQHQWVGMLVQWLFLAFIMSQCLFLVNLGMGFRRRRGKVFPR